MEHSEAYQAGRIVGALLMFVLLVGGLGFFIFALVKACTRKTKGWVITTAVMGVLGLGLVGVFAAAIIAGVAQVARQAKVDKVLTSEDGRYSISVPGSWKVQRDLNDEASIEGGNRLADRYAIVIVEEKGNLEVSLAEYARLIAADLMELAGDTATPAPESLTVGGYPAIRHRISGKVDNVNVTYHHTSVETPKALCQIMCWSLKKDEKSSEPIFDKVAASFVEKPE